MKGDEMRQIKDRKRVHSENIVNATSQTTRLCGMTRSHRIFNIHCETIKGRVWKSKYEYNTVTYVYCNVMNITNKTKGMQEFARQIRERGCPLELFDGRRAEAKFSVKTVHEEYHII